jgi:hypothetical protein
MNLQADLIKQFRDQQQKYAYYIIALCVAGIGFAIQKTIGLPLRQSQIPLGCAVLFWGLSIYCGLNFIGVQISALYSNSGLIEVQEGRHPLTGTHPEKIKIGIEAITKGIERMSKKTMRLAKWQNRLFYWGILFFLVWRIWEMYLTHSG